MDHLRTLDIRRRIATRLAIATAMAISMAMVACENGSDSARGIGMATPPVAASAAPCPPTEQRVVLSSVAELVGMSTIVVRAKATISHPTVVTAPLPAHAPKAAVPTVLPPDVVDRRNDPALQGRGYREYYFTDTTITVESVLMGSSDLAGRTIINRTRGDGINECTSLDPPAALGTSQLYFLRHDPETNTYGTTTGSSTGRFAIAEGRVVASGDPDLSPATPVARELDGKTLAEVRRLL